MTNRGSKDRGIKKTYRLVTGSELPTKYGSRLFRTWTLKTWTTNTFSHEQVSGECRIWSPKCSLIWNPFLYKLLISHGFETQLPYRMIHLGRFISSCQVRKEVLSIVRPQSIRCEMSEKAQCHCSLVQIRLVLYQALPQSCLQHWAVPKQCYDITYIMLTAMEQTISD